MAETYALTALEKRIAALEQNNRSLTQQCRISRLFAVLSLAGVAFMGGGEVFGLDIFGTGKKTEEAPREGAARGDALRVRELIIEDESETVRAKISAKAAGGVLQQFFDRSGTERVRTGIEDEGVAHHRMFDEMGRMRLSSVVDPTTKASQGISTAVFDKDKNVILEFGAAKSSNVEKDVNISPYVES